MIFDYFRDIEFSWPWAFGLFALIPVLVWWYLYTEKNRSGVVRLSVLPARGLSSAKPAFRHLPFIFRLIAISFLIVAIAGPRTRNTERNTEGEGIDIVLCIDVSGSMTAQDLLPNRLEAAKKVAVDFVSRRPVDRIGVVVFAGESFTQCPLTTDKSTLVSAIQNIRSGQMLDGTAIGSGLSTSVDRLRTINSKSKVVILLTDGENNGGLIDPRTAKEISKTYNIKVYTIGVGTTGLAPQPVQTPIGVQIQQVKVSIDENLMKEIASETGAQYFRAQDNAGLNSIYASIDQMEKTKMQVTEITRFDDKFLPFAIAAAFFLIIELLLRYLVFRRFP